MGEDGDTGQLEEEAGEDPGQERRTKPLFGGISCVVGALLGIVAVFAALRGGGANISAAALGVGFGVVGYFLGASKLATATVFVCAAAIIFGLATI